MVFYLHHSGTDAKTSAALERIIRAKMAFVKILAVLGNSGSFNVNVNVKNIRPLSFSCRLAHSA